MAPLFGAVRKRKKRRVSKRSTLAHGLGTNVAYNELQYEALFFAIYTNFHGRVHICWLPKGYQNAAIEFREMEPGQDVL